MLPTGRLTRLSPAKLQPCHQSAALPDEAGGPVKTSAVKKSYLDSYIKVGRGSRSSSWLLITSILSSWRSLRLIKDVGNVVVIGPHIVFQVVLESFDLFLCSTSPTELA